MIRSASAKWVGDLPTGSGQITTDSKILDNANYSFKTRFEEGASGTNPEELIAAAHAGCFSMAFNLMLTMDGFQAEYVDTKAAVSLEKIDGNFTITKSHLTCHVKLDGISPEQFQEIAAKAKAGCPISRVLNAEISLEAILD